MKIHSEIKARCKTCFKKTFDVTDGLIKVLLSSRANNSANIRAINKKSSHRSIAKTSNENREQVVQRINSFPKYASYYSRRYTKKQYLDGSVNVSKMYHMCKELNIERSVVSYSIYRPVFNEINLSFKIPYNDTCNICDTFKLQRRLAADEDIKLRPQIE